MDSNEIDTYLRALDAELAQRPIRKPVRIVVVGGVYMLFFLRNRSATKDVDIIPLVGRILGGRCSFSPTGC